MITTLSSLSVIAVMTGRSPINDRCETPPNGFSNATTGRNVVGSRTEEYNNNDNNGNTVNIDIPFTVTRPRTYVTRTLYMPKVRDTAIYVRAYVIQVYDGIISPGPCCTRTVVR